MRTDGKMKKKKKKIVALRYVNLYFIAKGLLVIKSSLHSPACDLDKIQYVIDLQFGYDVH